MAEFHLDARTRDVLISLGEAVSKGELELDFEDEDYEGPKFKPSDLSALLKKLSNAKESRFNVGGALAAAARTLREHFEGNRDDPGQLESLAKKISTKAEASYLSAKLSKNEHSLLQGLVDRLLHAAFVDEELAKRHERYLRLAEGQLQVQDWSGVLEVLMASWGLQSVDGAAPASLVESLESSATMIDAARC